MNELWLPIPGFDGYEASSEGRIKGPRKIHKQHKCKRYLGVTVKDVTKSVHRLVAMAFHGLPPFEGAQCLHKDDNPMNNRPENLYWGTHQQNMIDKVANGGVLRGEKHPISKLTAEQVLEIRRLRLTGMVQREIAELFGTTPSRVSDIVNRKDWTHLP